MNKYTIKERPRFGAYLRKARRARCLTQGDLAERSDVAVPTISIYETTNRDPTVPNLVRLADALHVSTDFLLGRAGEDVPLVRPRESTGPRCG